jgi:hypothetical protein
MPLENGNKPSEPTLSEPDRAAMDVFLDNILGMLPVLGIHAFEQSPLKGTKGQTPGLTCQGRGVTASGQDTPQGFVVQAGSFAAKDEVPSLSNFAVMHNIAISLNDVIGCGPRAKGGSSRDLEP